ncbi:MAG: AraC family transcriptional regulator [Saprospiraceae bacterium]|nr:AraC family transcriptional regulator [Saprospiraceae bacterium]
MIFNHPYYKQLVELESYIRANLDQALSVEVLAQRMHLSTFHFHRIFKSLVGESVHEYVTRIRLEVAAMRLKFTADKIQDIAFAVGYHNPETFIRAFNRRYQSTPSAFRKTQQQIVESRLDKIVRQRLVDQVISTQVKRLDPIRVAFLTHKGPYHEVGRTWEQLMQNIPPLECGRLIGIPFSDPHTASPEQIRYDACVEIRADYLPQEQVQLKELPGGQFVETVHLGPFEKIDDTYHLLYGLWLPSSRFELRNEPSLEIYLTDSRQTLPEEARTAIYLPIKTYKI